MMDIAEREHAFLGARFVFVAARAADRDIEAAPVKHLPQRLRFHDVGMQFGTV
jgi:hypothetical protein